MGQIHAGDRTVELLNSGPIGTSNLLTGSIGSRGQTWKFLVGSPFKELVGSPLRVVKKYVVERNFRWRCRVEIMLLWVTLLSVGLFRGRNRK